VLLLTADWHIRKTAPAFRKDDFQQAVRRKILQVFRIARRFKAHILIAGDLGDKPQWANSQLAWFIRECRRLRDSGIRIVAIPGQHDLPAHDLSRWNEEALGVLHEAGAVDILTSKPERVGSALIVPKPYGVGEVEAVCAGEEECVILMAHQLVFPEVPHWAEGEAVRAEDLLDSCGWADLILCGDNHQTFVVAKGSRVLISPGSLLRLRIDQLTHRPAVFLYDERRKRLVRRLRLRVNGDILREEYVEVWDRKLDLEEFIDSLKAKVVEGVDFEENLKRFMAENQVSDDVREKILAVLEEVKEELQT